MADRSMKPASRREDAGRPLAVTGMVAAMWAAGLGLTTLTTVTLVGWIAAPRAGLGTGLPGVFRTAVGFWLVAHHAGFSVAHGRVGLLPLGLIVLPGMLLFRCGGWIARTGQVRGRHRIGVVHAALALAVPYSVLAALLAILARSSVVRPSAWQALLACFLLALVAGGLGAACALVSSTMPPAADSSRGRLSRRAGRAMFRLLPHRARSLATGITGATATLLGAGALIFLLSMAFHPSQVRDLYGVLRPGIVGGILLTLVALAYLPNAAIWAFSYAVGPGFAVGVGTSVAPAGVFVGMVPSFPPFAALPDGGPAPAVSLVALAVPFVAGAVGGVLTMRVLPTAVSEAAPLWGFVCGVLTGVVVAVLTALSGGPLGGGRMAVMGPSPWQIGLLSALEVGISAAIAAWIGNWQLLRRTPPPGDDEVPERPQPPERVEFVDPEPMLEVVEPPLPDGVIPLTPDRRRES